MNWYVTEGQQQKAVLLLPRVLITPYRPKILVQLELNSVKRLEISAFQTELNSHISKVEKKVEK
jgi:hypothetical protein